MSDDRVAMSLDDLIKSDKTLQKSKRDNPKKSRGGGGGAGNRGRNRDRGICIFSSRNLIEKKDINLDLLNTET